MLKIPPVLCISCFGRIEDVTATVSTDFKQAGSAIVLVGQRDVDRMGGSTYFDLTGASSPRVPAIDLELLPGVYKGIYRACRCGLALACHDISEGGLFAALVEMCLGGGLGAQITIPEPYRPDYFLFNETAGCFLVETNDLPALKQQLSGLPCLVLGHTTGRADITAGQGGRELFALQVSDLARAWQKPMKEVFGA